MFNDFSIVATAVSSFNNAALYSPYFFVVGLFSIPLFLMTFLYGQDFIARFGWNNHDLESKIGFWNIACLVLWVVLMGGNYAVIRDSISLLPIMISIVLFVSMVFVSNRLKQLKYLEKMYSKKSQWILLVGFLLLVVLSSMPTWWGILLQLSAVLCGLIVGDRLNKKLSDIFVPLGLFGFVIVLILMQPEYFRFGQLGNLTFVHLVSLLLVGFFCVTALAARYTNTRMGIYQSAYVKLKWLCRILAILALILFVLTESVPVFIGLMAVCMLSEMLTIYHSKNISEHIYKQSWALAMIGFGTIIICPVITMMGIIYLTSIAKKVDFKDYTKLL